MAPSTKELTAALEHAVAEVYHSDKREEELTVKRIRLRVEQELGLPEGFFIHEEWKEKSKNVIRGFAVRTANRVVY